MNIKIILFQLKKHAFSILFYGLIALFLFSPAAKSWLLQQVVATGLLKANIDKAEPGKIFPDAGNFSFTDATGKSSDLADLKGKVVLINFWASWCPPCRAEMPDLEALYQKLKDDDRIVFLFMNEDEDRNKAMEYLNKNHPGIPLFYATSNVPTDIFGGSLPTTLVLNKELKIVLKKQGMAGYNTEHFIRQLKQLL
jgi:thiol-disulfide isomerase/thioredoxin